MTELGRGQVDRDADLRALGELSRVGDQITKAQRELAYLTTSLLNNCHY